MQNRQNNQLFHAKHTVYDTKLLWSHVDSGIWSTSKNLM